MRKAIPLLAAIVLALATAGGAIAHRNGDVAQSWQQYPTTIKSSIAYRNGDLASCADIENEPPFHGRWHCGNPHGPFYRGFGPQISVSDEFKENVINIAESDQDVQNLLAAGYENMRVQPIIKATVQGNGDVIIKATGAIVTLRKDGGWASVQVDLEAGKVTKIVTVERTVIEKSTPEASVTNVGFDTKYPLDLRQAVSGE